MQLKQRIKKIEEAMALNNPESPTCICWGKHLHSAIAEAYNDDPNIKIEVYPAPDFEKGYCDKCRKPISKNEIRAAQHLIECYERQQINELEKLK